MEGHRDSGKYYVGVSDACMAIEGYLPTEHAFSCKINVFPFPLSSAQLLGDYFFNGEWAATNSMCFSFELFSFVTIHRKMDLVRKMELARKMEMAREMEMKRV
jgi:hypothetical protein